MKSFSLTLSRWVPLAAIGAVALSVAGCSKPSRNFGVDGVAPPSGGSGGTNDGNMGGVMGASGGANSGGTSASSGGAAGSVNGGAACDPGSFLRCDGKSRVTCNPAGTGEVVTACPEDGQACTEDICDITTNQCGHLPSAPGAACGSVTVPMGICVNNACHCGGVGEPCCSGSMCEGAQACANGTCGSCGAAGQDCCNGSCAAGNACDNLNHCEVIQNCDDRNPCTVDSFDPNTQTCGHTPGNAGTACRPANGVCDVGESCSGASADCPPDAFTSNNVCRAAAGFCDVAESCPGTQAACPSDGVQPVTLPCRASAGICDPAEICDGISVDCPVDALSPRTTECRVAAGACDVAETCTGDAAACPADVLLTNATVCRASAGVCDVAETCTGDAAACPADVLLTNATMCRASAGVCDAAENCSGNSAACPGDSFLTNATVCRASAGACDVAENCPGNAAACPGDSFLMNATVCRASAGACDVAENCPGNAAACPGNQFLGAATVCRASAGVCDPAETCPGNTAGCPVDAFSSASTGCRPSVGPCDLADKCPGNGAACSADAVEPSKTKVCRAPASVCDVAEVCTGTTPVCPADAYASNNADVVFRNSCFYLDGSKGACQAGYTMASQLVLSSIAPSYLGKTYKTQASDNCCIQNADPDEDWGAGSDCSVPMGQPWTSGPTPGGAGCTNLVLSSPKQLTLCGTAYPNALGGVYSPYGADENANAKLACESVYGLGGCSTDGCGSCNNLGWHKTGAPNCNGSTYWNFGNDLQNMGCNWNLPSEILISLDGKTWGQDAYADGLGGSYMGGPNKKQNALVACEHVFGKGQCCNDACGGCNDKGFHQCGTPNCNNGSTYWNYFDNSQTMACGWTLPSEILIATDGLNWTQ